ARAPACRLFPYTTLFRSLRRRSVAGALLVRDDADHLAGRHRLPGRDRETGDRAGLRGAHLVLHLHRLDDADDGARLDGFTVDDCDRQHRSLHRRHDRVAPRTAAATPALGPAARELAPGLLGLED